jgi:UDP-N-acetyl-D-galactosamine dehydrogenase
MGYHSQIILSGRKINDNMGKHVAEQTIKKLIRADRQIKGSKVAIYGVTFKENCPDVRNTKVVDIIDELKEYGVETIVYDPEADREDLEREYAIKLNEEKDIKNIDAVILAVPHNIFKEIDLKQLKEKFSNEKYILIDVKGLFDRNEAEKENYIYWRL